MRVRTGRVNAILGTDLTPAEMRSCLEPIGFGVATASAEPSPDLRSYPGETWDVTVPTWRPDSSTEIDVIEEVGRLWSYSRITRTVPKSPHSGGLTARQRSRRRAHDVLAGFGLMEAMPLPFLAPGDLERCGLPADGITVTNPLVAEESVMRTSLRPGS